MPISPETLEILRRVARSRLTGEASRLVDDAVGDACVRLLRALERTTPDDLPAFAASIAERAAIDQLRRLKRDRLRLTSLDNARDVPAPPPPRGWDRARAIRFLALEYFRARRPECGELARAHFRGEPWASVADRLQVAVDAVRQRWSRCRSHLIDALRADSGLLASWNGLDDDD
jgi:RNA polymerase sigma factor (sigma-70 family)